MPGLFLIPNRKAAVALAAVLLLSLAITLAVWNRITADGSLNNASEVKFEQLSTDGWQTFADGAMGIQLRYPPDWRIIADPDRSGSIELVSSGAPMSYQESPSAAELRQSGSIGITLRAVDNILPVDQWYRRYFETYPLAVAFPPRMVKLGSRVMLEAVTAPNGLIHYFAAGGKRVFDISFINTPDRPSWYRDTYYTVLDQIQLSEAGAPAGSIATDGEDLLPSPVIEQTIVQGGYVHGYTQVLNGDGSIGSGEPFVITPDGQKHLVSQVAAAVFRMQRRGLLIPLNSVDGDAVLLSATEFEPNAASCVKRIYAYGIRTGELRQLFSERTSGDSPYGNGNCSVLDTIGLQGSRLILWRTDPDSSPGPCFSGLLEEDLLYLELADVGSGLHPFKVLPEQIAREEREVQGCMEEFGLR